MLIKTRDVKMTTNTIANPTETPVILFHWDDGYLWQEESSGDGGETAHEVAHNLGIGHGGGVDATASDTVTFKISNPWPSASDASESSGDSFRLKIHWDAASTTSDDSPPTFILLGDNEGDGQPIEFDFLDSPDTDVFIFLDSGSDSTIGEGGSIVVGPSQQVAIGMDLDNDGDTDIIVVVGNHDSDSSVTVNSDINPLDLIHTANLDAGVTFDEFLF